MKGKKDLIFPIFLRKGPVPGAVSGGCWWPVATNQSPPSPDNDHLLSLTPHKIKTPTIIFSPQSIIRENMDQGKQEHHCLADNLKGLSLKSTNSTKPQIASLQQNLTRSKINQKVCAGTDYFHFHMYTRKEL